MTQTSLIREILLGMGGKVEDIPTSNRKSPDLLFTLNGEAIVIEEKERKCDSVRKDYTSIDYYFPDLINSHNNIQHNSKISKVIGKAGRQIAAASDLEHAFRIAWITRTGDQAEAMHKIAIATIFGICRIHDLTT